MHNYPSMTREEVIDNLPMAQGWAMLAWSRLNNGMVSMEIVDDGYLAQERHRCLL
jgi:hypothetical protein